MRVPSAPAIPPLAHGRETDAPVVAMNIYRRAIFGLIGIICVSKEVETDDIVEY
jgi:hypothetical protein